MMFNKIRELLVRSSQLVLGFDGVLHVIEVVSAIEEGATRTAILTGLHACVVSVAVYIYGHAHTHPQQDYHNEGGGA